jgi:hypothetical protein
MYRVPTPLGAEWAWALVPADRQGADILAKIPMREEVAVKIMRDRSLLQHRLFWSVLRYVAEATQWETAEKLLVALKLHLGRYDLMELPTGKVVPVPHSISFAAMTGDDFQDFFDKSIRVICSKILPDMDNDRLIAEAQAMLG